MQDKSFPARQIHWSTRGAPPPLPPVPLSGAHAPRPWIACAPSSHLRFRGLEISRSGIGRVLSKIAPGTASSDKRRIAPPPDHKPRVSHEIRTNQSVHRRLKEVRLGRRRVPPVKT